MNDFQALVRQASAEIADAACQVDPEALEAVVEEIAAAKHVVAYGVGREGLMMRALAMRLMHLGIDAHVTGDMTTPPVGHGDLLIVSAGPGYFSTVAALIEVAQRDGARTMCVTAQPAGKVPSACDTTLTIPAQTMADDTTSQAASVLPMGSLYEGAQYLVFELLVLMLKAHLAETTESMRARHTNLE
ncbi:MAG: SIS domain-containing protein [Burkholderiaceae bacterium]